MYSTMIFNVKRADVRSLRRDILQAIQDLGGENGVSAEKISEHLDCGIATVYRHIDALRSSGYIETGNNKPLKYKFTEHGKRIVSNGGK